MSIRSARRAVALGIVAAATSLVPTLAGAPANAAVSMSQVGPGWTAVMLSNADYTGRTTLIMVGPDGQKIPVGQFAPGTRVDDVSNDGRRVALVGPLKDGSQRITVYDLRARTSTSFASTTIAQVRFTNPAGLNLLVSRFGPDKPLPSQRLSLDGRVLATFPASVDTPMPSLDGSYVVSVIKNRVTLSSNATGQLLRTYAVPRGYAFCSPIANVSRTEFTAWCADTAATQVFRFSVSGTVTPVTSSLPASPLGMGYLDARQTPAGLVVAATPGCGAAPYGLYRHGSVQWFRYAVADVSVVGFDRTGLVVQGHEECDGGGDVLAHYDITTRRTSITFDASAYSTRVGTKVVRKAIASASVIDPQD